MWFYLTQLLICLQRRLTTKLLHFFWAQQKNHYSKFNKFKTLFLDELGVCKATEQPKVDTSEYELSYYHLDKTLDCVRSSNGTAVDRQHNRNYSEDDCSDLDTINSPTIAKQEKTPTPPPPSTRTAFPPVSDSPASGVSKSIYDYHLTRLPSNQSTTIFSSANSFNDPEHTPISNGHSSSRDLPSTNRAISSASPVVVTNTKPPQKMSVVEETSPHFRTCTMIQITDNNGSQRW